MQNVYSEQELHTIILPLAKKISKLYKKNKTVIIAIQGGQGTGKSVLSTFLKAYLFGIGYKVQRFSIDDFYTSDKHRHGLKKKYKNNPFYQISRGMPGTHRVTLLHKTLQKIRKGKSFDIPIFDKSIHEAHGDILPNSIHVTGRQDFIFFEGWCVGMPVVSSKSLQNTCKKHRIKLKILDPELKHHKIVLRYLKSYQKLWKCIDYTIMLKPDSVSSIKQWRNQQEEELKQKKGQGMSKEQISNFVEPYLPFTYLCYDKIKPNLRILIDKTHRFYKLESKNST